MGARAGASADLLIISDVRMPGMTGIDVLSVLRCAYWATPVILMSAFADATLRGEAWGARCRSGHREAVRDGGSCSTPRVALRRSASPRGRPARCERSERHASGPDAGRGAR